MKLREFAADIGHQFPEHYPSAATVRKDLQLLRNYGIFDDRMYR